MVSVDVKHHAYFKQIAADAHSEHRFPAPFSWLVEGCRKLTLGLCGRCSVVVMDHTLQYISLRLSFKSCRSNKGRVLCVFWNIISAADFFFLVYLKQFYICDVLG